MKHLSIRINLTTVLLALLVASNIGLGWMVVTRTKPVANNIYSQLTPLGRKVFPLRMNTLGGNRVQLDSEGNMVIVYHTMANCSHCINYSGKLAEAASMLGIKVVALGVGDPDQLKIHLSSYITKGWALYLVQRAEMNKLGVKAWPTTWLIGKDGKLLWSKIGDSASLTSERLFEEMKLAVSST